MEFNERLKALRAQASMTQKQHGESVGVSTITIRNWETGVKSPSMPAIISLSKAFHVSSDFLLGLKSDVPLMSSPVTNTEARLLSDYRELDSFGRKAVDTICSLEKARVSEESKKKIADFKEYISAQRYIPKYTIPSAAGFSAPLDDDEYEMISVDDNVPYDADFAVEAHGNSMSPYIHDGETVFVKKDCKLNIGDVGIFVVNGARYCKQYYIDENRNLTLVSANPEMRESNVYVSAESDTTVVCCGKVLLPESIPLPTYFLEE